MRVGRIQPLSGQQGEQEQVVRNAPLSRHIILWAIMHPLLPACQPPGLYVHPNRREENSLCRSENPRAGR
jgi:hypothetical protein